MLMIPNSNVTQPPFNAISTNAGIAVSEYHPSPGWRMPLDCIVYGWSMPPKKIANTMT